jgi:hypothetical protein
MGRKSQRLVKKLEKKVIKQLGQDVVFRRNQETGDTVGFDAYGEPLVPSGYVNYDERTIRIVVDEIKYDDELKSIGSIPDQKREILKCFISQSEDISIGDVIIYPSDSEVNWMIYKIVPNVFQDQTVVFEVEAYRDATTN